MKLEFYKNHGLGNDFVILSNLDGKIDHINKELFPEFIRYICDRNIGIGGDGLLIISNKQLDNSKSGFDIQYTYYNCDGNEAEICGNGLRCYTKALLDMEIYERKIIKVKSKVGIHNCQQLQPEYFQVEMGKPNLELHKIPAITENFQPQDQVINQKIQFRDQYFQVTMVNMGNPHCVIFVDDVLKYDRVEEIGNLIQNSQVFPEGVNVGFAQVINRNLIQLRVYERGCGETQACGSGACASVVAGVLNGLVDAQQCQVNMHQGQLDISIDKETFNLTLRGQAKTAFQGIIQIPQQFMQKTIQE